MYGFGIDVPYIKGTTTFVGHPVADNSGTCASSFAVQQMLSDLGYYTGPIDGAIGTGSMTALRKFSEATGVPYVKGTFPKAATCQGLIDAWVKSKSPAVASKAVPTAAAPAPASAPTSVKISFGPSAQAFAECMRKELASKKAGGPYNPSKCTAILSGASSEASMTAAPVGFFDKMKAWWGRQSTMVKVGVVGGGAAAVGLLVLTSTGSVATANRRRR